MAFRISLPPITRSLLVLHLAFTLLFHAFNTQPRSKPDVNDCIALTPQLAFFHPWTLVTAVFAETSVFTLLLATTTVFFGGKYLERAWGAKEFGKFVLVVTVLPNLIATVLYLAAFAFVRRVDSRYGPAHTLAPVADGCRFPVLQGSIALQAAFLVAFKQLVPEHTVTILKGLIKIRVKHFTAIFLVVNTISGVFYFTTGPAVLSWLGFFASWTYLRFYKPQPDLTGTGSGAGTARGDASDTFAFAYFWPDVVHAPIALGADKVFNLLVLLQICTPFSQEEIESSNQDANARSEGGLPNIMNPGPRRGGGGKREDTERRRALALKALDQRLQAATAGRSQPSPAPPATPSIAVIASPDASETARKTQSEPLKV
jgi:membrane associated rhomboid family serine protease